MSLKTLPLLYLNMGGEMMYILDQRLQAQQVKREKATKVLNDIISTMFSAKFMDELFKPQELCSKKAMRTLFDKLAHASIMRLNQTSMDKLYDLMTMAAKFQFQSCVSPRDILMITMNHLDGMRKLVHGQAATQQQLDHAYQLFVNAYKSMSLWELQLCRMCLLNYYQDSRIKVSILLREKRQSNDGRFVVARSGQIAYGALIPGSFRSYTKGRPGKTTKFQAGGEWTEVSCEGSLEKTVQKQSERGTELGTNMYKGETVTVDTQGGQGSATNLKQHETLAKEELDLLSHLMGVNDVRGAKGDFSLSLFANDDDEEEYVEQAQKAFEEEEKQKSEVIRIDASKRKNPDLDAMIGSLSVSGSSTRKAKGDELLDLMDSAK